MNSETKSLTSLDARRILIADDNELYRELLVCVLSRHGYTVREAADGEEAWDELRHSQFDLLITDNEMPRLEGIQLIERIRHAGMSLPIIFASSALSIERAQRRPELHVVAVLAKPFGLHELSEAVRYALFGTGDSLRETWKRSSPLQPSLNAFGLPN